MATEAKARFNQAQGAWIDFTVYLRTIEDSGVWNRPEFSDFKDFLRKEFPAAYGIERYGNIKRAVDIYGVDFMRRVGSEVAHCLATNAMLSTDGAVDKVRAWCEEHFRQHGVMPEYNTIVGYTKRATQAPRHPLPKLMRQRNEVAELRSEITVLKRTHTKAQLIIAEHETLAQENARLRAELKVARARIRELEAQLRAAQKQVEKFERSSGAKSTAGARGRAKKPQSAKAGAKRRGAQPDMHQ
jgi:regulator of replication initiation timing